MGRTAGFVTGKKKRFACGLLAAGVLAAITVLMPAAVFCGRSRYEQPDRGGKSGR